MLELKPDDNDTRNNLGNVLTDLGQLEAAVATYREALKISPDVAELLNNLGNVLRTARRLSCGDCEFSARAGDQARFLGRTHYNLGNALQSTGMLHSAAEKPPGVALDPNSFDAHCNLGSAFQHRAA